MLFPFGGREIKTEIPDNKLFLSAKTPNYYENEVLGLRYMGDNTTPSLELAERGSKTLLFGENAPYYEQIAKYDWNSRIAYSIMMAESRGEPKASNLNDYHPVGNCRGSYGLFQLACFRGNWNDLVNPEKNIELAYELWKKEGWSPWGAYHDKSYLKFYYE